MKKVAIQEFGSLDHDYPVLEVYLDDKLVLEIITRPDGKTVEALASEENVTLEGADLEKALSLLLPAWKQAVEARNRNRA